MFNPSNREVLIWLNSLGISHSNIDKLICYFDDLSELWTSDAALVLSVKSIK